MSNFIAAIARTRQTAAHIAVKALTDAKGHSEAEIRDRALSEVSKHPELFPTGWYDPPPSGIAVLCDTEPFTRLQFETLRKPEAWPRADSLFSDESVSIFYLSPVDRQTGALGDLGLSLYSGTNKTIQEHLKVSFEMTVQAAEQAEVGMKFCDLYLKIMLLFKKSGNKVINWTANTHNPLHVDLGHTAPGSYGDSALLGTTFEDTREAIRTRRLYISEVEQFEIPATCAFTVEPRLTDFSAQLPNVFFHVIVTFNEGEKRILTNFDTLFCAAGMDYML